ncbi:ABC transporter [Calderihabitans maritimus]|uniref:ABC transporter n=2 Tax=Calderihabitans maritimus TaxID=1246530 RepID=A0A1Z5HXI5_9FIRM|nr:ABC transporter [Calderihabitans maritimus]
MLLKKALQSTSYDEISATLGKLHGFPQKAGQHLTLYLTDRFQSFYQLYNQGKPEPIRIHDLLKEAGICDGIEDIALAAQASIGQVYRLRYKNKEYAVKVKYEGIERKIRSDFSLVSFVLFCLKFFPFFNPAVIEVADSIRRKLLEECDYIKEAYSQQLLGELLSKEKDILIPRVESQFCNDKLLVNEWISGTPLHEFLKQETAAQKQWFLRTYLHFVGRSIVEGLIHADPHPGNFLIVNEKGAPKLAVLDFGCMVELTNQEKGALIRLLLGEYQNEDELIEDLRILGFTETTLTEYQPVLGDIVSILLEPFYYDGEYDFRHWRMQYKLNTILSSRPWKEPLSPPAKVIYVMRVFHGLYFYARSNDLKINWYRGVRQPLNQHQEEVLP